MIEAPVLAMLLRLLLALAPAVTAVELEGHCRRAVSPGFVHCGCTAAFLASAMPGRDAALALGLIGASHARHRGEEPTAASLYRAHGAGRVDRAAQRLFEQRLALAQSCPLNFPIAD